MKPPRLPDPRKLLAGLAAARADGDVPTPDEQLRELERRLQCRARQTRERRLRKLMEPPEPPERTLTVRAMEQIRYLRRAFPEEWPAGRLAQGFGVTPEEIRRVLRSRFRPSPERALAQDARAAARRELPAPPPPPPPPAGSALPACRAAPSPPPPPGLEPERRKRGPPGTPRRALPPGQEAAGGSPWLSGDGRAKGAAQPLERGGREGPRREEGKSRWSLLRPRPG
ncbi:neugrin [Vipera latastei]